MNPKSACVDGIYLFIYCTYGNIKCDAGMGEDAEGCVQAFQEKEERRGDASEALQLFDGSKEKQLKKIDTASVIYFILMKKKIWVLYFLTVLYQVSTTVIYMLCWAKVLA